MIRRVLNTAKEVKEWFVKYNQDKILACDTECVDASYLSMEIAGVSFCNGEQACYIDLVDNQQYDLILKYIKQEFHYQITCVIFHNAPFDLRILHQLGCDITPNIFCTMTTAHLIDENQRKGLKLLAQKYLGVTETIDWNEAITQGFHSDKFYQYALNDVCWTWNLAQIFIPELKRQGLWELWETVEKPFQFCLRDLAINGIAVDKDKLLQLQKQLKKKIFDLQLEMFEAGDIEYYLQSGLFKSMPEIVSSLNLNSSQQLVDLLINKLNIELTERTNSSKLYPEGQFSTKSSVLKGIKNKHKFIELLLEYRTVEKLLNSFLEPLPKLIQEDGRVRPSFHNCVTVTGRLSCSSPNLQQLPK